jgi:hypothetical protein
MVIPRNNSRLIPDRKTRYAPEPSPFDTDPAAAAAVTYNVRGEANGVDPLRIQRLKAKKLPLPATYRSPLRTAGQVWFSHRVCIHACICFLCLTSSFL